MEIDPHIEKRVREVYRGVIAKDPQRMVDAVSVLTEAEHEKVVTYGLYVLGYTVTELLRENPEDETALHELAGEIIETEGEWAALAEQDGVAALLKGAVTGNPILLGIAVDNMVPTVFVAGGYMLAHYRGEGQKWSEYLDEIWNSAQAAG